MLKNPFTQFIESFNLDSKLKLSRNDFVDEIKKKLKVELVPKIEKLKSVQEFPSTGTLSLLSWKVYDNLENEENQTLPEGWELLTTAHNKEMSNGYFGAAFWNPQLCHVIIAHRGTELNNIGAVVADLAGIVLNNCGGQMESACTFTDKIVQTLVAVEKENEDVHFELFFTGHR